VGSSGLGLRTALEREPEGNRFVAFGIDRVGWGRGATTADDALSTLEADRSLPFLIRHSAVPGHAWEMEDRDLTGEP
jgi:hypothetical protein